MQRYTLIKIFGIILLVQMVLVGISFFEVFVYSTLVNPGHEVSFYEAHAEVTAPWVSGIFGFILFFFVVRYWTKKKLPNAFKLALFFPLVYVVWDIILVALFGVPDWLAFLPVFALANGAKVLGSAGGYYLNKGPATPNG